MKYIIYLLLIAILLLWYAQENSSKESVTKTEGTLPSVVKQDPTITPQVKMPLVKVVKTEKENNLKVVNPSKLDTQEKDPVETKEKLEEKFDNEIKAEDIEDEEKQDITPVPPKSQEELADEGEELQVEILDDDEEEQDTTPAPPKSQEELADEAESENEEADLIEDDDKIEIKKDKE